MVAAGAPPIDEAVKRLLDRSIESYEELEALLLLFAARERVWVVRDVAERLGVPDDAAKEALEHLVSAGLCGIAPISGAGAYQYRPASDEIGDAVERLARAAEDRRVEIMKIMSKNAVERVRTAAIRTFAEAFVLGRKKDG